MRIVDLLGLSLSALWQQKLRVVLTTLGVLFGAFVLTTTLAVRQGVQATIVHQYKRFGELRLIDVMPPRLSKNATPPAEQLAIKGTMSEAKRKRLQQEITARWQRQQYGLGDQSGLTTATMQQIAALDHVVSVKPLIYLSGRLYWQEKGENVLTLGVSSDDKTLASRVVAGGMMSAADSRELLVSEYTLYRLGITDDAQVEQLLGKKLRLEMQFGGVAQQFSLLNLLQLSSAGLTAPEEKALEKIAGRLPDALAKLDLAAEEKALLLKLAAQQAKKPKEKPMHLAEEFTVCGVLATGESMSGRAAWNWAYRNIDVALPLKTAEGLYLTYPRFQKYGFERLLVEVDEIEHVKAVNEQIKALGLETDSLAEFLDREQFTYLLIFSSMTIVSLIALLVAALGITNTMLMSVLERVREIGIMKAVGARELHLRLIFLLEGGLVGLIGGLLGLLLGWAVSFPADAWVKGQVESRLHIELDRSIFAFPLWLVVGAPLFAWLTTTLAAYYPARRAARIDPIHALRHE